MRNLGANKTNLEPTKNNTKSNGKSNVRHRSTWIRAKTGVKDIVQVVKKQKWRWTGHIATMNDNRWTKRIAVGA